MDPQKYNCFERLEPKRCFFLRSVIFKRQTFLHSLGVPNIYPKHYFLKAKFNKNFETTKVRNLKFGDMRSLKMRLCTSIGGVTTSRALWQMRQKPGKT